jgi:hypothetical protein
MSQLEDLVRFETANSSLAFRELAYGRDQRSLLLRDVVALANAAVEGPRFLFVGVRDAVGGEREICGIARTDWTDCKELVSGALRTAVEPLLKVTARSLEIDGKLVGLLCLPACNDRPYLLSAKAGPGLHAGAGWIRRGTECLPLLRADLERIFAAKVRHVADAFDVVIGFPGDPPQSEITLPALPLDELPSAVAAKRLHKVLEAQQNAKAILGKTETRFSRLVHAQVFGVDQPYERHSEDSLRMLIAQTADDCRAADEHYQFELRAHKLEVVVCNRSDSPLSDAALHVTLPRLDGIGVAERLYRADGSAARDGYPLVTAKPHTVDIETPLGTVPAGATLRGFREAPRLWTRPAAAGITIPVDCTLRARELREPLRETLVARIVAATPRR